MPGARPQIPMAHGGDLAGGCFALELTTIIDDAFPSNEHNNSQSSVWFRSANGLSGNIFKAQLGSFAESAKLYLICFLAGFSERLVPDVMSRLAAIAEKETGAKGKQPEHPR
jgi:hypothetical protein